MLSNQKSSSIFETLSAIWFQQQFDQLHKENALILKGINDIERKCDLILLGIKPNQNVSSELESVINLVSRRAILIDLKVPDKNVPPG